MLVLLGLSGLALRRKRA